MQQVSSATDHKLSETDHLSLLSDIAGEQGFSFTLWRLPATRKKHVIISKQYSLIPKTTIIEELDKGFVFAPFNRERPTVYLPADLTFTFIDGKLKAPEDKLEETSAAWMSQMRQRNVTIPGKDLPPTPGNKTEASDRNQFQKIIEKGIQAIENGVFEKIVPSRFIQVNLPEDFDLIHTFQRLCDLYPNALVSLISIPETGVWLGATPEVLVAVENHSVFRTVALAGTQPFHEGVNLKSVAWTQKEIEEQALVNRYIINCFKKLRLREYEEHGPKTVVAGNLMHLRTDFTVDMKATNFPQLGSSMLQLLHPTSAVCGMPLEPAMQFLQQHEGYDREFYAGYLGPVNFNDNIDIFVNLRCMQVLKKEALLYAGAGVTADSNPEKEWMETEIKFETLLKAIF